MIETVIIHRACGDIYMHQTLTFSNECIQYSMLQCQCCFSGQKWSRLHHVTTSEVVGTLTPSAIRPCQGTTTPTVSKIFLNSISCQMGWKCLGPATVWGPWGFPKAPEIKNFREGNSSRTWLCSSSIFELQNEQSPSTTPDQTKPIPQPRKSGQQPMDRTNVQQPLWFCSTDVPLPFQDMAMPLGYAIAPK